MRTELWQFLPGNDSSIRLEQHIQLTFTIPVTLKLFIEYILLAS